VTGSAESESAGRGEREPGADRFSAAQRFRVAWSVRADLGPDEPELLPTRLTRVALTVLPVDGVGLSALTDDHRVPLGATDDRAVAAERLQFTIGEGPCLEALRTQVPISVDRADMERRWPPFHAELLRQSPYRSIVALPLPITDTVPGALDLYFHDPAEASRFDVADAAAVAGQISAVLGAAGSSTVAPLRWEGIEMPAWMYGPPARDRLRVWVAVGVLMSRLTTSSVDALALLRAHAYARDQNLDEVTNAVIDGSLPAQSFRLGAGPADADG